MNLSNKIFAYIKITRPLNVVITFCVVVVAILISQTSQTNIIIILISSIAAALVAASGNIINDIYDIETDKISHPNRVLVLGNITKKEAVYLSNFINTIAIILTSRLSDILLLIVVISIIVLFFYSFYLKKLPLVGNVVVAFLTGLAFIYGGFAAGNPAAAIVPAVFAFLINLIREIVKDMEDVKGDTKAGVITFPVMFGFQKSKILILFITFSLILYTLYPYITELYKIEYFIFVMVFVNPLLILCLKFLFDTKKEKSMSVVSNILKLNMVLGLIAIYLGK
ncbi:MAG: geranylgeranylglycerol-phosphate geranylgeranyltransferase [Ignavibacteria bacterium]|nr:geranylgeranylglycerol-phosphate geranylgeranyltransferase [Ignavibacteria bacterium]